MFILLDFHLDLLYSKKYHKVHSYILVLFGILLCSFILSGCWSWCGHWRIHYCITNFLLYFLLTTSFLPPFFLFLLFFFLFFFQGSLTYFFSCDSNLLLLFTLLFRPRLNLRRFIISP